MTSPTLATRKIILISLAIGALAAALFFVPALVSADDDASGMVFGHCYISDWNGDWDLVTEKMRNACGNPAPPDPKPVIAAPVPSAAELAVAAEAAAAKLGLSNDVDLTDYRAIDAALLKIAKAASKELGIPDTLDLTDYRAIDAALAPAR